MTTRPSLLTVLWLTTIGLSFAMMGAPTRVNAISCVAQTDCPSGLVCDYQSGPNFRTCQNLSLTFSSQAVTANSFSVTVQSNSQATMNLYYCLGSSAVCTAQPVTNTNFWSVKTGNNFYTVQLNGLRPGRTYTATYQATINGATATQTQTFTTWPDPLFTPAESGVNQNSASITWTTPFSGNSQVYYSPTPVSWANELSANLSGDTFTAVTSVSTGEAWAVTYGGRLVQRSTNGTWSVYPSIFPATHLRAVDFSSPNDGWIVGDGGFTAHTSNGGSTWQSVALPNASTIALQAISISYQGEVWAAGQNQTIFHYTGSSWNQVYSGLNTQDFSTVLSFNNKEIFAAGTNGQLFISTDAGATWPVQITLPGGTGINVNSLASFDGQTIWAGGGSGKLWRSIDRGQTWSSIPSGTATKIVSLVATSGTELWLTTSNSVGRTNNATAPVPTFTFDNSILPVLPDITYFAVSTDAELFSVGSNIIAAYSLCHPASCSTPQTDLTLATNHTINLNGLSGGTTYYYAAESFGSGVGWGEFGTFTTTNPDTIPPTISFVTPLSPGPVYTNSSPYPVSGTASDTAPGTVQSVTLTSNGSVQTVTGTTSWSSSVPLVAGLNSLVATATDGGSNTTTATSSLFYDTTKPSVSITAPANNATVNVTPTTVSGTASDNDQVAKVEMSLNGGPRTSVTITPGASVSWSTTATLVTGANTIVVYATDRAGNEQSAQVTVTYAAPTFTLSASPASQSGFVGDVKTYTINLTSQNSFSGAVNLSASSAPAGPIASFNPASVNLSSGATASSTMDVATANISGGTYTITITGVSGGITKTATVQLILSAAPDFSLSATPSPLNIVAGNSSSYQVTVSANNTFAGPIAFTLTGSPTGVTGAFNPTSVTLANSQTNNSIVLNIATQPSTANGDYTLSIIGNGTNTANGATISHTSTVILHISPAPDIGLDFQPPQQTVQAGGAPTSFNGTITSLNGYGGTGTTVTLSATSDYAGPGLTLSLQPNQIVMASGDIKNSALNVTAGNNVPGGTYLVTIVAHGSGLPAGGRQTTVNLVVVEDTTPPVISNISATPNYNNVRVTWTTNEPADSSISIYTDAARTNLVGTISDATSMLAGHNLLYQPLNPLTTYYFTVSSTDFAPTRHTTTVVTDASGQALHFTTLDTPDTTPPTVVLTQPADSTPPSTVIGTVTVSGTASDDKNVSQVTLTIVNQTNNATEVNTALTCAGPTCSYTYNWNTTQFGAAGNGPHTVTVVAKDAAGNLSAPVTHTVNVDNDYSPPVITSGPDATGLTCGASTCQITITWTTDDASTSEVGYDTPLPQYCDQVSGICTYSQHQQYDDTAPADASPAYTSHSVTLKNLEKNVIYHYRVFSCNRSNLCLQGG